MTMEKKETGIDGLLYARGDIFDLESGKFDAIIVFMESGFNNIQARFLQLKEELEKSPVMIVPFGNYVECQNNFKLNQINTIVYQTLNAVVKQHRRNIGFHGIRAIDADDYTGAKRTINAIAEWLQLYRNCIDSITLVDAQNCYAEHF